MIMNSSLFLSLPHFLLINGDKTDRKNIEVSVENRQIYTARMREKLYNYVRQIDRFKLRFIITFLLRLR